MVDDETDFDWITAAPVDDDNAIISNIMTDENSNKIDDAEWEDVGHVGPFTFNSPPQPNKVFWVTCVIKTNDGAYDGSHDTELGHIKLAHPEGFIFNQVNYTNRMFMPILAKKEQCADCDYNIDIICRTRRLDRPADNKMLGPGDGYENETEDESSAVALDDANGKETSVLKAFDWNVKHNEDRNGKWIERGNFGPFAIPQKPQPNEVVTVRCCKKVGDGTDNCDLSASGVKFQPEEGLIFDQFNNTRLAYIKVFVKLEVLMRFYIINGKDSSPNFGIECWHERKFSFSQHKINGSTLDPIERLKDRIEDGSEKRGMEVKSVFDHLPRLRPMTLIVFLFSCYVLSTALCRWRKLKKADEACKELLQSNKNTKRLTGKCQVRKRPRKKAKGGRTSIEASSKVDEENISNNGGGCLSWLLMRRSAVSWFTRFRSYIVKECSAIKQEVNGGTLVKSEVNNIRKVSRQRNDTKHAHVRDGKSTEVKMQMSPVKNKNTYSTNADDGEVSMAGRGDVPSLITSSSSMLSSSVTSTSILNHHNEKEVGNYAGSNDSNTLMAEREDVTSLITSASSMLSSSATNTSTINQYNENEVDHYEPCGKVMTEKTVMTEMIRNKACLLSSSVQGNHKQVDATDDNSSNDDKRDEKFVKIKYQKDCRDAHTSLEDRGNVTNEVNDSDSIRTEIKDVKNHPCHGEANKIKEAEYIISPPRGESVGVQGDTTSAKIERHVLSSVPRFKHSQVSQIRGNKNITNCNSSHNQMKTFVLLIEGMVDEGCAGAARGALMQINDIKSVSANLTTSTVAIKSTSSLLDCSGIGQALGILEMRPFFLPTVYDSYRSNDQTNTYVLPVEGMIDEGCAGAARGALMQIKEIKSVTANLSTSVVVIKSIFTQLDSCAIVQALGILEMKPFLLPVNDETRIRDSPKPAGVGNDVSYSPGPLIAPYNPTRICAVGPPPGFHDEMKDAPLTLMDELRHGTIPLQVNTYNEGHSMSLSDLCGRLENHLGATSSSLTNSYVEGNASPREVKLDERMTINEGIKGDWRI